MFNFVRNLFSRKESAVGSMIAATSLGRPVFPERNYANFAAEAYQKNIIAYRCIELISTAAASVPWLLYDDEDEIVDHPLLTLLRRPNPMQTGKELFTSIYAYDLISGNAYIERVMVDNNSSIKELYSLRVDRMKVIPGRFGLPQGYEYTMNGRHKSFEADPITGISNILHVKRFNPLSDWYGQSPLEAMGMSVDSHNESTKWNYAVLKNAARPSGALEYEGNLNDDEVRQLKEEIEQGYSGARRGKPMLLQGGLKWVEMMLNQKEMEWVKGKEVSASEIAIGYKVPEQLVGVPGQQTYNNFREARMALYEDAVLPLLDRYSEALTNWFSSIPGFENLRVSYDEDKISALSLRRESAWDRVNASQFLTVNEKREAVGYEPFEEIKDNGPGDQLLVPAGLIPISDVSFTLGDLPQDMPMQEQPVAEDVEEPAEPVAVPEGADPAGLTQSGEPVQSLALNGAQIQAIVTITQAVANGELPAESAIGIIMVAFPTIDEATARALVQPAEDFEPPAKVNPITGQPMGQPKPEDDEQDPDEEQDPAAEEAEKRRRLTWWVIKCLRVKAKNDFRQDLRRAHRIAYGK